MADLCYLPIILGIILPCTVALTYAWSLHYGHVGNYGYPYISDTGYLPPERCVFGQLLNMCAAMMGVIVYVRHKYLTTLCNGEHTPRGCSRVALWFGWISSFGVSIVANFQVGTLWIPHIVGASLAFVLGTIYLWFQVVFTFKYGKSDATMKRVLRLFFAIFTTIFLIVVGVANPGERMLTSRGDHPEFAVAAYTIGAIAEWLMAGSLAAFMTTFTPDFWHLKITAVSS